MRTVGSRVTWFTPHPGVRPVLLVWAVGVDQELRLVSVSFYAEVVMNTVYMLHGIDGKQIHFVYEGPRPVWPHSD